ncbi:YfgM family protein [Moraxella oculi]|uniref:Ancillary SecYEG translocon subunit n=1 Tax=Moraxella oculi TaxID=2940516 RepID=A0ABW8U579_9GAMM
MSQDSNMADKQAMSALKQHGSSIILVILVVLAGYFGWEYYQKNYAKIDTVAADLYTTIEENDDALRLAQYNAEDESAKQVMNARKDALFTDIDKLVATHGNTIYAWQALMIKARQQTQANDLAGAVVTLDQATKIDLGDEGLLAMTKIRHARAMLANGDTDKALKIANESMPSAFEASRQEMLGDIYVAKNDIEQAKQSYTAAWEALRERQENRAVLTLKLQSLGVEVEPIAQKTPVIAESGEEMTSEHTESMTQQANGQ